jgi:hypothetical protein
MLPAISAAIGILTMMSLVTFVAGSVPPSTPFAESTITVNEKEINCGGIGFVLRWQSRIALAMSLRKLQSAPKC